jgi:hypothetical protein
MKICYQEAMPKGEKDVRFKPLEEAKFYFSSQSLSAPGGKGLGSAQPESAGVIHFISARPVLFFERGGEREGETETM